MINFLKFLMGMKLGHLLLIIGGLILTGSLIKNILTGSFSIVKFVGGFNIFAGGIQGKLIYYGIIFALVTAISLGIYHRFTQETYENTYNNVVKWNDNVTVDQRQIIESEEDILLVGIKIFGLKIGITAKGNRKPREIIDNTQVEEPLIEKKGIISKLFGWLPFVK